MTLPGSACDSFGLLMFVLGGGAGAVVIGIPLWLRLASLQRKVAKR